MTCQQLIDKLKTFPPDAKVVTDMCSECRDLDDDEPQLILAEDRQLILRNGVYITWSERYKKPGDPDPEFVTAVHFPGN